MRNISPAGCTVLISTLEYLNQYHFLKIIIPEKPEILGYLERMNFFRICNTEIKEQFDNQTDMEIFYRRNRNNKENELFEISKSSDPDDISKLHNSIRKILKVTSALPKDRINDIASIISELGNNSLEHAECSPFSCIQYYASNNMMKLAICDTGQGIYNSLKDFIDSYDTHSLIEKAILTTVSKHINGDRGKGLMDVKTRAFNFNNVDFYLRTHDSAYKIKENELLLRSRGEYFFGTFFYLTIQM